MATIVPVVTRINENTVKFFWETLTTTNDRGTPIPSKYMAFVDRTVQVTGTPGVGGNLRIQGSNDDAVTYAALADAQGNALDITAAKIEQILEVPLLTRPFVSAGDGTTDLDVSIVCRRSRSGQEV
ncbi:MAG: hypothetical protein A3E01_08305 [Gammaproteobacteria bacterium RIFCSPHIGHO2_12_FULL_63_22]|nr:MAG: hypothetical protein A3E01_08305 [Gammaproteobacteria bacterium RIFCSPHIGHO2_12_FULL_63_22]